MIGADRGLRRTLYLFGGGVIVAIAVVAAALILSIASRLIKAQADRQLSTYASRTARIVETAIGERRHEAELLALLPLTEDLAATGKGEKGADPLDALLRLRPRTSFRDLAIYGRDGRLILTTSSTDSATGRGTPWFRAALTTGTTEGVPYPDKSGLLLDIATPIRREGGRDPIGVLRVTLPLEFLGRPLRRDLRVDGATLIEVVDQRGMVAVTGVPGGQVGQRFADDSLLGRASELRLATVRDSRGSERLALVGVARPDWTVVARQPSSAALAILGGSYRELAIKALAFALLALILLAWLATWIDRRIVAPVTLSEGVASRVAHGDLRAVTELPNRGPTRSPA